jgi:Na+-driven multidrug efflux pump
MIPIFTGSQKIIEKGNEVMWLVFIFVWQDFYSAAFYGFIKALNLQKSAIKINFVAHQLIILPCAFYLSFYVGSNNNPEMEFKGMELTGVWIAMCIGMGVQDIAYHFLYKSADYEKIA